MSQLALYLLKMSLCSGVLYAYYHLALRNRVFHQYNRFYLLAAVLFSLIFPLIPLPQIYTAAQPTDPIQLYNLLRFSSGESEVAVHAAQNWNWQTVVVVLYIAVCLVLAGRLIAGLLQIRNLMIGAEVQHSQKIKFVLTNHAAAPFSFFNWLFWKREIAIESEGGQSIFRHELVHIQEKHTVDKLVLQTVLIIFWINPFFWLLRRELQMIHEFIADKKSVGADGAAAFAAMILAAAYGKRPHQFANAFFQQPIKRRLAMLQKTMKQPQNAYLGRVLSLPLCAILLFAFARKESSIISHVQLQEKITVMIDAGHGGEDAGARGNGYTEKMLALELAQTIGHVNKNPNIELVFTRAGDEYPPLRERVAMAQKTGADLFISLHMNSIGGVKVQQDKEFEGEGFEVSISGKNKAWQNQSTLLGSALIQQLSAVYTTRPNILVHKTPGVWVLDANTVPAVLIECGYISSAKDVAFMTKKDNREIIARKILAAIEAYAQQNEFQPKLVKDTIPEKIDTGDIREIRINKTDTANTITIIYKNGKEEVLTEKQAREKQLLKPPPPPPIPNLALLVIDGKEQGPVGEGKKLNAIHPENIESMNVLKGEHATKKYGEKGKNGVIEIITKKGQDKSGTSSSSNLTPRQDANIVHLKVEEPPHFPGGEAAWQAFLQKNLDASAAVDNSAPTGKYTVQVQFKVANDGSISDIQPATALGYGMEQEVVALMQKSPKWIPAEQNGYKVTTLHRQKVTFVVAEE